jgi:hypothetical protein
MMQSYSSPEISHRFPPKKGYSIILVDHPHRKRKNIPLFCRTNIKIHVRRIYYVPIDDPFLVEDPEFCSIFDVNTIIMRRELSEIYAADTMDDLGKWKIRLINLLSACTCNDEWHDEDYHHKWRGYVTKKIYEQGEDHHVKVINVETLFNDVGDCYISGEYGVHDCVSFE